MSGYDAGSALLPNGLHDVLAPAAAHEAAVTDGLLRVFEGFGYDRVKPPLVEFEATLSAGGALDAQMFRVMDPVSNRMMAVRADITLQVARIAASRLGNAPRPLRLSYAGQVLRVSGTGLRPERQFTQAGVELVGPAGVAADVEAVVLAAAALRQAGLATVSVDLTSPAIVTAVVAGAAALAPDATADLHSALERKDVESVAAYGDLAAPLAGLILAAGPAESALTALSQLSLPPAADAEVARLRAVVDGLAAAEPDVSITIDPVEYRGFEYQTGVSFTLFARGVRGELGRGGRYVTIAGEDATGFTLFLDSLMRAVPPPERPSRVFLPYGTEPARAAAVRDDGWIAVAGLTPETSVAAAASAAGCDHIFHDGAVRPLPDEEA